MQHPFPASRLYRMLSHPAALIAGAVLTGLSLIRTPNLTVLSVPGGLLLIAWVLLASHRQPKCGWTPRNVTLRALEKAESAAVSLRLVLTGRMCIGRVAAPVETSRTLSIRSQSSTFLLATAAALTCHCHSHAPTADAIVEGLTALGVDPDKMQRQWLTLSYDTPQDTWGVTVRDGDGTRCFFMGDPAYLILSCGRLMKSSSRPMCTEDRTELLRTLDAMYQSGGNVIAYAMLKSPAQPLSEADFLGMLSLEQQTIPSSRSELAALSRQMNVFANLPDGVFSAQERRVILPVDQCSDTPLWISLRAHSGPTLMPDGSNLAAEGWSDACMQWKRWSRQLVSMMHVSMIFLPFFIWQLISVIRPGPYPMLPMLLPAVLSLCLVRPAVDVRPSIRWVVLWPVLTLALSALCGLPLVQGSPQWYFVPGAAFASVSACIMSLILPLFCAPNHFRTWLMRIIVASAVVTGAYAVLFIHACPAALLACGLGVIWGTGTLLVLRHRLMLRM